MSSGLDHIDQYEVKKRGILLGNTLQVLDDTVADIAVGLMIAASRQFKEGLEEVARFIDIDPKLDLIKLKLKKYQSSETRF